MQYQTVFHCCLLLLSSSLGAPQPEPQVLFRDSALALQSSHSLHSPLHSLSHHSHSVQDSTRRAGHHSLLSSPSLVQHSDGRLFAVNANLQPGQLFQTSDGRIFTLATTVHAQPLPSTAPLSSSAQEQAPEIIDAREASDNEEATEEPSNETTTMEPVVTEAPIPRRAQASPPRLSPVIATAPFTPSTARFISAIPAPSPVTHVTHSSPSLLHVAPATRAHSLADSSTVTGYFSFPSAGLDFDF